MKTIDKQHIKPRNPRVGKEDYLHIFSKDDRTFKVSIHLDYSYPAQSRISISHWNGNEWKQVHYIFGPLGESKFGANLSKIEDHLVCAADKVMPKITGGFVDC